ncbi:MAG: hypothetical protein QKV96_gp32 [Methanophagales virus GBV303]|uniref:Glycosyltransferase RgtA/B/C/D-like domain-containing protein n=1 Tax=Methanophagales virus GBV303 TaxID=2986514 RepID=A0A9E9A5Z2_9VIRU|nr:MAG: hypothetical protein QKV96_gp32 [Methanophagales virus GBV303]WAE39668.1 MAG: hypothetical protein NNKAGPMP_00032 [Methanophagales virus GBV303]
MRKYLFALFGIAVAVKLVILSITQFQQPLIVMDETLYFLQAKEIWTNHTYILHNKTFGAQYPPLYPLILSPLTAIVDVNLRYMSGLAVNTIISSLLIFPIYEIARMYLDERKAFIISAITAFAPLSLTYSFVWMSENLYFPLFAYSVLWILREEKVKAGIGVGLAALTKVIGLALIPFMIWKFRKHSIIPVVLALSLASIHFLFCLNATGEPTGYHYHPHTPSSSFFVQLFLVFVYLSCATAPSLLNFDFRRHIDIIALAASYTVLVAFASQLPQAHGRYYECLIPILLIPAFDEFARTRAKTTALCILAYFFFALPTLIHADLVNASLTLPITLSTAFTPLTVFAIAFALLYAYILTKDDKWRRGIALALLAFVLLGSSATNLYNMHKISTAERECVVFNFLKQHSGEGVVFLADMREWWANYCLCCFYAQNFLPLKIFSNITKYLIVEKAGLDEGQKHIARLEGCCENDEVLVVEMVRWDEVKEGEKGGNEAEDY